MFLKRSTCSFLIRWRHSVLQVKFQQQQKSYFPGVRQILENNEDKIIYSQIIDKVETRPSKSLLLPTCHATHLKLILVYYISKKCLLWKSTWIIACVIEIRHFYDSSKKYCNPPKCVGDICQIWPALQWDGSSSLPLVLSCIKDIDTMILAPQCNLLTLNWAWSILPEKLPLFHSSP